MWCAARISLILPHRCTDADDAERGPDRDGDAYRGSHSPENRGASDNLFETGREENGEARILRGCLVLAYTSDRHAGCDFICAVDDVSLAYTVLSNLAWKMLSLEGCQ